MTNADSPIFGIQYDAFLFDMDGTLVNSIASAERVWGRWAQRHGLDVATFLPMMHGKRGGHGRAAWATRASSGHGA